LNGTLVELSTAATAEEVSSTVSLDAAFESFAQRLETTMGRNSQELWMRFLGQAATDPVLLVSVVPVWV
jgi:hypothetical protein